MPKGIAGIPEQIRGIRERFMRRNDNTEPIAAVTMKGAAKE
jgi:hypothetical protein